jgi:hypothetical protein
VVGEEVAAQAVLDVADLLEPAEALGDRVGERVALLAGPGLDDDVDAAERAERATRCGRG